ncbi:MAG: sigma-54 dependent transcriptional regulator [candidate division Zixibacteria bacterium]|nr:sigma-54 dependent transcriptional regulator [candidate division Zixibacteria bacterium]
MANILVVDDEPRMTSLLCGHLEDSGHQVTTTTSPAEALRLIDRHSFDIVITDLSMPEISGMAVLDKALEKEGTEVIMMTAYGTVETAVAAMKKGAADYLVKPFALEEMELTVSKLISNQRLKSLSGFYRQTAAAAARDDFIGSAPAFRMVQEMIARVAVTDSTVLISGRSGTGKEIAARMIHELSPRRDHPFIAINCAALTETLLESELFGHEKGAFTGAVSRKRGRFELADKGTLFLDEIGEMSASMQSKLLRVIEEHKLVRVGGVDLIDVDVRVVAATNRNLKEEVAAGTFREDLYFRISVFPIEMPTLAERKEDLLEIAAHFLKGCPHPNLSPEVSSLLLAYDWPGNIRELKNVLERAVILAHGEPLTLEDFSLEVDDAPLLARQPSDEAPDRGLEATERTMILEALEKTGGNKTEAAGLLKISRRRLYSRMKVHGIKP